MNNWKTNAHLDLVLLNKQHNAVEETLKSEKIKTKYMAWVRAYR